MSGAWTPELFEAADGTIPFEQFVEDLSAHTLDADLQRVARAS